MAGDWIKMADMVEKSKMVDESKMADITEYFGIIFNTWCVAEQMITKMMQDGCHTLLISLWIKMAGIIQGGGEIQDGWYS